MQRWHDSMIQYGRLYIIILQYDMNHCITFCVLCSMAAGLHPSRLGRPPKPRPREARTRATWLTLWAVKKSLGPLVLWCSLFLLAPKHHIWPWTDQKKTHLVLLCFFFGWWKTSGKPGTWTSLGFPGMIPRWPDLPMSCPMFILLRS